MGVAVVCRNDEAASLSEPVDECPEVFACELAFGLRGKQRKCIVLLGVAMNETVRPATCANRRDVDAKSLRRKQSANGFSSTVE